MLRSTSVLALGALLWLNAAGLQAQGEAVRITVPRANVRAAASTSSPVLTQVTSGTVLPLKVVEGSWFLVEVATGGLRVEGWVSSTVATRVSAVERATASAANGLAATAAPVSLRGVSVAIQSETEASPLTPEAAAIRVIDADANSLRGLLRVFPADDAPLKATGGEPATFVWTLPGRSSGDWRSTSGAAGLLCRHRRVTAHRRRPGGRAAGHDVVRHPARGVGARTGKSDGAHRD
jgi:hypothetical protein